MDLTHATGSSDDNARSSAQKWGAALALWIILVVLFFWPVFFHGKVLAPLDILDSLLKPWATTEEINVHNAFPYDAISQYLPYNWSVFQSLRQDGYIGWNPYTHNGTATLENTMLCPGDWHHQLYRFLSFWDAWDIGIVLQFILAGVGMLFLLRHLGIPPAFALLGVIGYGFYSQFITWYCHRWILGALCWAPWMVWAFLHALKRGKRIDAASALFTALAFRGGHLQSCIFVVIITAIVFLTRLFESRKDRPQAIRVFTLLVSTAFFSTLLSLDVWLQTIPAYLQGCPPRAFVGWMDSIKTAPVLVGLILPTLLGTPQGLNIPAAFGSDLFEIAFLGATTFILGVMGLLRKDAPRTARILFLAGILLPLTPASTWLYSRCTPIFALGCAWLACWRLWKLSQEPHATRFWKKIGFVFALAVLLWSLGSIGIHAGRDKIEPAIQRQIAERLPGNKASRAEWMSKRTTTFIDRSMVWYPENLAVLLLVGCGLLAASQIHSDSSKSKRLAILIAFCAFGEIYLYSRTWVTFSDKPTSEGDLYNTPGWVATIKDVAGNGAVVMNTGGDFDYMQLNTPSTHGIRFQNGYETVTPLRCSPLDPGAFDPKDYALAGVSCYLVNPVITPTNTISAGWQLVHDTENFKLYRNPSFTSRFRATLSNGETIPIQPDSETVNTRTLTLPPGIEKIHVAETYNRGWKAKLGESTVEITQDERNGMVITLPQASTEGTTLRFRFSPWLKPFYVTIIGITLAALLLTHTLLNVRESPKALNSSPNA